MHIWKMVLTPCLLTHHMHVYMYIYMHDSTFLTYINRGNAICVVDNHFSDQFNALHNKDREGSQLFLIWGQSFG